MNIRQTIRHISTDITLLLCAAYIVIFFLTCLVGMPISLMLGSKYIGNSAQNLAHLQAKVDPNDFIFCVMGDIKGGTATFEELLDTARADKPAFAVILGDFVCHSEPADHKLFVHEVTEDGLSFPLFLVPGNHDISFDGFSLKDFEDFYGPAQFHFTIGKYLFVFLNNVSPHDPTSEYLSYLEKVLADQSGAGREIFIFMHIPPRGLNSSIHARRLDGSDRFMQLVSQYGVRYVFTGDHHGYIKTIKDQTTYIVTGGGGARLRGDHGKFHHMVRMAIKDGTITETVISNKKRLETLELTERNLSVYLWPILTHSAGHMSAGILMLVIAMVYSRFALKRRKLGNRSCLDAALAGAS